MNDSKSIRYISEAYQKGRLSHAYIIEGQRKEQTRGWADDIAQALLCERTTRTGSAQTPLRPCGTCPSCIRAKTGNHPDIIHVIHEKETVLSVGEIREQVVGDIAIRPYYGPLKIYVIPDAGLMNESAQNALLKTIEEPQSYGLILLLTDNADGLLPTIRSRCVRLRLSDPSRQEAMQSLLDEDGERAAQIIRSVSSMTAVEIGKAAKELEAMDRQKVLRLFQFRIRDLLVFKSTQESARLYDPQHAEEIRQVSRTATYEALNRMLLAWDTLTDRLKANVRADAAYEAFLLQIRHDEKEQR